MALINGKRATLNECLKLTLSALLSMYIIKKEKPKLYIE